MVIWLKKFSYSKLAKLIACLLFCVSATLMFFSLAGEAHLPWQKSWHETSEFIYRITDKAGYVRDWIVRYGDESIFKLESITEDQIKSYRALDNRIQSDEEAIKIIFRDRKDYFNRIQQELIRDNVNVAFFAVNLKTGQVITNIESYNGNNQDEIIDKLWLSPGVIFGNGSSILSIKINQYNEYKDSYYGNNQSYYDGEPFEGQEDFEIYVAIPEVLQEGDWFYKDKQEFNKRAAVKERIYLFGGIGIVLAALMAFYWICVVGQREKNGAVTMKVIDKVPLEFQIIPYVISMLLWGRTLIGTANDFLRTGWMPYAFESRYFYQDILIGIVVSLGVLINLFFASSLLRHIKNKSLCKYILVIRIIRWVFISLVREKILPITVVLTIGAYFGMNMIFAVMLSLLNWSGSIMVLGLLAVLGFNAAAGLGCLKMVLDYIKIFRGTRAIAQGHLKTKVELKFTLPIMQEMAYAVNHIGEGLERAVVDSLKSERLKTELITNVSHDLKTPLTSIISYIDLLKQETIENEAAKDYIQILDERSNRLKHLVEDLVEASKAVTGNVKANLAPVELHELARQAIGEYTDRLEVNGLAVILSQMQDVRILADGRHMYRVLENLLSNVNKYAMPHTRVYIDIIREGAYGVFVIKNISKEYLNVDPNELTKRFVRGDKARSTDGSGLGLAIAESLVKLQNGTLNIQIDGDLFKVEVKIPIA